MDYEIVGVENKFPKINSLMRDLASQISFSIKVENDEKGIIFNTIKEIINEMNFSITDSEAMLNVISDYQYQDVDLGRKEDFVKYEFDLSVEDYNGRIVISLNEKSRSGGINKDEAISKSKAAIVRSLQKKLQVRIEKYFDTLAQ